MNPTKELELTISMLELALKRPDELANIVEVQLGWLKKILEEFKKQATK